MKFTNQEIKDLLSAISEAQWELCDDPDDPNRFPEAHAYNARLEALVRKLKLIRPFANQSEQ